MFGIQDIHFDNIDINVGKVMSCDHWAISFMYRYMSLIISKFRKENGVPKILWHCKWTKYKKADEECWNNQTDFYIRTDDTINDLFTRACLCYKITHESFTNYHIREKRLFPMFG